jgi:hypothetical protein
LVSPTSRPPNVRWNGLLSNACCEKLDHLAVVGRDEAGRTEQVGLAQAALGQRRLAGRAAGGDHRRVPVLRIHPELRLVVGAPEPEGHEPGVQQARWYGSLMFSEPRSVTP